MVLSQQPEDAGHAADAVADFGEQFGSGAGAERVQVLSAALKAEAGKGVEVNHAGRDPWSGPARVSCELASGWVNLGVPVPIAYRSRPLSHSRARAVEC